MLSFFADPTFFVFLSFLVFAYVGYSKLKGIVRTFLDRQIEKISSEVDRAAEEKERALQQLTRANKTMTDLPTDISKVWEEQIVDFARLQENVEREMRSIEMKQEEQLENIRIQVARQEYDRYLHRLSRQFVSDIQQATAEQKASLFQQSLSLLGGVSKDVYRT